MRSIVIIISFLFSAFVGFSQFGFSAKYEKNNYENWNNDSQRLYLFEKDNYYQSDLTIGANYWFRLKNKRVEFLPEVNYTLKNTETSISGIVASDVYEIGLSRIGFQFNTHVYPMDFEGDCNCPTWGKDSDFMKKGFYFVLSPGFDYFFNDITLNDTKIDSENFLSFKIGIGAGIDIGVSNLLTVSPFVLVNFYPSVKSTQLDTLESQICTTCEIIPLDNTLNTQVQAGIRISFRPDYKY